jgi:hypothetical protein
MRNLVEAQQLTIRALERRVMNLEENQTLSLPPNTFGGQLGAFSTTNNTATSRVKQGASWTQQPLLPIPAPTTMAAERPMPARGDDHDDSLTDLHELVARCALNFLNARPDDADGEWCEDCDGPCQTRKRQDQVWRGDDERTMFGPPPAVAGAKASTTQSREQDSSTADATGPDHDKTVMVAGARVAVEELLLNPAVEYLQAHPSKSGRWCEGHGERKAMTCSFVHRRKEGSSDPKSSEFEAPQPGALARRARRDEARVVVEGTPIPLTALEHNKAVEMLLTHPTRNGLWCDHDEATHDVTVCYRIHKRRVPGASRHASAQRDPTTGEGGDGSPRLSVNAAANGDHAAASADSTSVADEDSHGGRATTECVLVSGLSVRVSELRRNPAVEFLIRNPTKRGRWCAAQKDHNPDACQFVHRLSPLPPPDNAVTPTTPPVTDIASPVVVGQPPAATKDAGNTADETPRVNVAGDWVPVTTLAPNSAVSYLLEHPHKRGRWCSGHGRKTVQECTFIHTKHDNACSDECGETERCGGSGTTGGDSKGPRTTRMVVYYEPDDEEDMASSRRD